MPRGRKPKAKVEKIAPEDSKSKISDTPVEHRLILDDKYYITCDSHCWILKSKNKNMDSQGKKYSDYSIAYASTLRGMLEVVAVHYAQLPVGLKELSKKVDDIYSLLKTRIPTDIRPKDLFVDFKEDL